MEKFFKHYGLVVFSIIGCVLSLGLILFALRVQFVDILTRADTTYDNYNKLAVSSNYNDNSLLDDTPIPELSVVSYVVDKGNYNFNYFGQAYCNGLQLSEDNFYYLKNSLSGNQINLEIYSVNDDGLYENLSSDQSACLNIRDDYFNVPEGYTLVEGNVYSYEDSGIVNYAIKHNNKFYSTDISGSYIGNPLDVTARIDSRGTYKLKYVVTNANGMQDAIYVHIIIN